MYRLGHRLTKHYLLYAVTLVAVLLLGAAIVLVRSLFQANTVITDSPAVVHHIASEAEQVQQVSQGSFTLGVPNGWHAVVPPPVPYTVYSWQGKAGSADGARRLDVYVDTVPSTLAVNRLLPVQADQDHLDILGNVSDNCVNFTDKTPQSAQAGYTVSKWSGVNFLCDTGNYERDVVATGSAEGINMAVPSGATSGRHAVLLVYTDNNASPDYTVFITIVRSFHLI